MRGIFLLTGLAASVIAAPASQPRAAEDFCQDRCLKAVAECYISLATTAPKGYGHIDFSCAHEHLRYKTQCTYPRFEPEPIPPRDRTRTTKVHTKTNLARQIFVVPVTTLLPSTSRLVDSFDIPKYTTSFDSLVASPVAKRQHGFEPELEHAPGAFVGSLEQRQHGFEPELEHAPGSLIGDMEKRQHRFDVNDPLNALPAPAILISTSCVTSTRTRKHLGPTHLVGTDKRTHHIPLTMVNVTTCR